MTTTADVTVDAPARGDRPPHGVGIEVATALCGLALAVLVGVGGAPGWRIVRVAAVVVAAVALVAAEQRASERWRGRLAVLTGVAALAIAAGFAPHVVKAPRSLIAAATVIVALCGIVLTASGTVIATRQRRIWRRIAAGATVLLVTAVAAFVVSPAVMATNVPATEIGATPAQVGLAYRDVTLLTDDGVSLAAWYVPSSNRAAVVVLHGAGSTRSNVLDHAAVLAGAGFGVLMVDSRGHGESGGQAMDFGWHGDADIAAATSYLASLPDVDRDRIGLVGLSMGGEEALGASATNELIGAVVAEGATARTAADEAWLSTQYGPRGWLQEQLERAQDLVTGALTDAPVPISLRAAVEAAEGVEILLVTAGAVSDEGHAAAHIAAGASDRVEIWTVPDAGHTEGLRVAREEWVQRVVTFLTVALVAPSV